MEPKHYEKCSYEVATNSNSNIRNYQISNSTSFSIKTKKNILLQIQHMAKEKLLKKYDCSIEKYNYCIINNILRNDYCHIVTLFKDILIKYSNLEFFVKKYNIKESKDLMKKFYPFYQSYFNFYCKPIFNCLHVSLMMKNYFDIKAKCFLESYQHNINNEENISKKSNVMTENKTIELNNDCDNNIFNEKTKEVLDNVTIMTTLYDNSVNGSINLNIDKEKVEIFRENRKDYSTDSTYAEIIDYIQNKNAYTNKKNKFDNIKNKLKKQLTINKNKILKNILNYNRNNCDNNINNINNSFLNIKKIINRNKIHLNKLNAFLKQVKLNNIVKKINRNLINNNINKSLENQNIENYDNVNMNINSNTIITDFSNFENKLSKNVFTNNSRNINRIEKANNNNNNNNVNSKLGKKSLKNLIINDYQNKEIINNDYQNIIKYKKIFKNNNKKYSKDSKIINQKISIKNKKKLSRNKISFYQYIQGLSSIKQKNECQSKNKKLCLHKTFIKHQSNSKKNVTNNNTNNISKIVPPLKKHNHTRYKTKFIKYQNIDKIFKKLYSKIKNPNPNNNYFYTINTINSHSNNKSSSINTLTIDNNMNTMNTINDINTNSINTLINNPINNSINNTNLKQSIYSSIYCDRSYKSFKKNEIEKTKLKIQSVSNFKHIYKNNCKQNSIHNSHTNKSISLLNKTSENNNLLNRINDVINKINYNSLSKKQKYKCTRKLSGSVHKKIKNIKSGVNNNSISIKNKPKLNINENTFKNNKKHNTITHHNRNYKSLKLNKIYHKIKKINNNSKNEKKIINDDKNIDKKLMISGNNYYKINNNFIFNSTTLKCPDNKKRIKNMYKKNNVTKPELKYAEFTTVNESNEKKMKTFHNKSLSTYGVDLNYKKIMKFKM